MTDQALLRAAIAASGLSARQFAVQVLARDERTIRRWLAGRRPIPAVVTRWLAAYLEDTADTADVDLWVSAPALYGSEDTVPPTLLDSG